MDIYEITNYQTGIDKSGVNYLLPSDSFTEIRNGFIHRQVLQSRKGISLFAPRLSDGSRITGIFEPIKPDGTRDLLVTDQNYLYKYNTGTGNFDQISFAGTMAGYSGFGLTNPDSYISGTAYPTGSNTYRFVFCCLDMTLTSGVAPSTESGVFFYDGTDVRNFLNTTDNTTYEAFSTAMLTAKYVSYFGERLNFIVPQLTGGTDYGQGVLFSAIRTAAGNGDKFNTAGSGLLILDTDEYINGASILGDMMDLNLSNSSWIIEKTTDPFNPYRPRKIPSVIGTDADFSFTQWGGKVETLGKSGILGTSSQQSLRVDDKIPNFTADEIEQKYFNYTYGGFDRENGQFLWSFVSSETEADTQDRVLVHNYEEKSWSVYDIRLTVFGETEIGRELTWDDIDENIKDSWYSWDTTEEQWNKIGLTSSTNKVLAGDDEGFIYQMNQDFDDYTVAISAITQATSAVLTVSSSAFKVGDFVAIQGVEGMTEINSEDVAPFYEVTAATNTSITLNVNSSNYTAYSSGGILSKVINFSAKTNPFNPYREQGRRVYVSMIEVLINSDVGEVYADVYQDGEEAPFKENVLMQPSNTSKSRNWVELAVNNESDFFSFAFRMQSFSTRIEITSVRIHAQMGGFTYG